MFLYAVAEPPRSMSFKKNMNAAWRAGANVERLEASANDQPCGRTCLRSDATAQFRRDVIIVRGEDQRQRSGGNQNDPPFASSKAFLSRPWITAGRGWLTSRFTSRPADVGAGRSNSWAALYTPALNGAARREIPNGSLHEGLSEWLARD